MLRPEGATIVKALGMRLSGPIGAGVALNPRNGPKWNLDEDYWRDTFEFFFAPAAWANAKSQVEFIIDRCDGVRTTCLDMCCGAGRHAIEMAAQGYKVTAVDASKYLLSRARRAGVGLNIRYIQLDLERAAPVGQFDLVLCLDGSIGQFDGERRNKALLLKALKCVADGGHIAISCLSRDIVARQFKRSGRIWFPGGFLDYSRERSSDWSRVKSKWRIFRRGKTTSYQMQYCLFYEQWFSDELRKSGFNDIRRFGGFDGRSYDETAYELVIIAKKQRQGV